MEVDQNSSSRGDGFKSYYTTKIEELLLVVAEKSMNLRRLQAQRNELNAKGNCGLILICKQPILLFEKKIYAPFYITIKLIFSFLSKIEKLQLLNAMFKNYFKLDNYCLTGNLYFNTSLKSYFFILLKCRYCIYENKLIKDLI